MNAYEFLRNKFASTAASGGTYTPDEAAALVEILTEYHQRIDDFNRLIAMQHERMARASKVFKRANNWPAQMFPDLAELIDWLLDRSGRKEAEAYKATLLNGLIMLESLGNLTFDKKRTVEENFLIELRVMVKKAVDNPLPRIMEELAKGRLVNQQSEGD